MRSCDRSGRQRGPSWARVDSGLDQAKNIAQAVMSTLIDPGWCVLGRKTFLPVWVIRVLGGVRFWRKRARSQNASQKSAKTRPVSYSIPCRRDERAVGRSMTDAFAVLRLICKLESCRIVVGRYEILHRSRGIATLQQAQTVPCRLCSAPCNGSGIAVVSRRRLRLALLTR